MTTPRVQRYNAIATYNGTNWTGIEQFNTLGTVAISGTGGTGLKFETTDLLLENKTTVKNTGYRNAAIVTYSLITFDTDKIIIAGDIAAANGDKVMVEIEVFNEEEEPQYP